MALPKSEARRLAHEGLPNGSTGVTPIFHPEKSATVVDEFCSTTADCEHWLRSCEQLSSHYSSVHRFLPRSSPRYRSSSATQVAHPRSLLSTLFDEIYHGPTLFRRMYGVQAHHYKGRGFIENERLLIRPKDLETLSRLLGGRRLALVTGRPYLATKHVLRDMMKYFNRESIGFHRRPRCSSQASSTTYSISKTKWAQPDSCTANAFFRNVAVRGRLS